jgi:hypothetical protein
LALQGEQPAGHAPSAGARIEQEVSNDSAIANATGAAPLTFQVPECKARLQAYVCVLPSARQFKKEAAKNMSVRAHFAHFPHLILISAGLFFAGCSKQQTVAAQEPAPNQAVAVAPTASDAASYTVSKKTETPATIARQFISRSTQLTVPALEAAIRKVNNLAAKDKLTVGQTLTIPDVPANGFQNHSVPRAKDFEVKAVYLTGYTAGSVHGYDIVKRWHDLGGNAVVFDIKDSDGSLSVPFSHALAPHNHPYISNMPKLIHYIHSLDMHVIARIALFRDNNIAQRHPELAVRSRASNGPWAENGKQVWADSSNPQVQDYNIALAKEIAKTGADEIQFDYVRFPAEGNQKDAKFYYETAHPDWQRKDVISDFLARAYSELHPTGVLLSLDVFGVMAWQRQVDLSHTGQDIAEMAKHCDVLSPMIYPSHFFGMDGYAAPGDAPEHFISESMERFYRVTKSTGVVLRPWLQAFAWRTKTYSPEYIETQVATSKKYGGIGFLFWNARNDYTRPYSAMPIMNADAARYYGKGDAQFLEALLAEKPHASLVPVKRVAKRQKKAPAERQPATAAGTTVTRG